MDIWGDIYLAEHEGRRARHTMERDDGREKVFDSAAHYFKAPRADLRDLVIEPSSLGAIIIMGNTLGAHQTAESLPRLFRSLRRAVVRGGSLLCSTVDPLHTDDESHLDYHETNRQRGQPPGLIRMRMKFGALIDEWMTLYLPTDEELEGVAAREGWALAEIRSYGPHRARLFRRAEGSASRGGVAKAPTPAPARVPSG